MEKINLFCVDIPTQDYESKRYTHSAYAGDAIGMQNET